MSITTPEPESALAPGLVRHSVAAESRAGEPPDRQFLDLIQGLDAIVWEMDAPTFSFTFVSERAEHILGYPVSSWLQEPGFWQNHLVHPDDRAWAFEYCTAATRDAKDHEFEYRAVRADGEIVWLRDVVRVVSDEAGVARLLRGVMFDISREMRAREKLREREAQLAEAQEISGLGSWEWDIAEDRITWSDEQFRLHGREPIPTVDYAWFFSHIHPDDQEWFQPWMERVMVSGDSFEFPYRVVRPDGEIRWLFARGRMEMSPEGRPLRMVGTSQDITAQRLTEETLRASEESYRTIFDSSNDAIFLHDLESGAVLDANHTACVVNGFTLEELRSSGVALIGNGPPPFTAERAMERIRKASTGEPQRFEWCTYHHKTGEEMWVEVSLQRVQIRGEDRLLALVRDIRERKMAELALRASEESYRTVFQLAGAAIWVHDVATGEFLEVNQTACELFGYTAEEFKAVGLQGTNIGREPYTLNRAAEYIARAVAGEPQRFEWLGLHRDGSEVWLEMKLQRVTILGQDRLLATGRDIKEQKAAEQALLRANEELELRVAARTAELAEANVALEEEIAEHEAARERLLEGTAALQHAKVEAERANRAKSEFLSRMSHELRTPMNSILGFAQLLARCDLPADQQRSVQHILKAGRHLLNLINEVLEIARIEAGRQNLSLEPVRLGGVVQEAVGLVRPLAAQWHVQLDEGPWDLAEVFARADRQRLVQVMLNLLSNAIKYNRPDGRVRVTCGSDDRHGDRIFVRVEDSGPGIDSDRVDQLFTPFARLGAEQSDVEGTGLGLALSQRLTEAMGGSLTLERTGPDGSVFRLELARATDPVAAFEEPIEQAPAREGAHREATLLYIEDNLANLSLVETILLSRPRWRAMPALQGQLGLELAREHRPDLILLDLHLPDISGEEVLRRLREDPRTHHIPVVVISADATPASLERLRLGGADAYLTKPLDIDEFLETVGRFLQDGESSTFGG